MAEQIWVFVQARPHLLVETLRRKMGVLSTELPTPVKPDRLATLLTG